MPGIASEWLKLPVIKHEQFDAGQALYSGSNVSVALGQRQLADQLRQPGVKNRTIVAPGLMPDGTRQLANR